MLSTDTCPTSIAYLGAKRLIVFTPASTLMAMYALEAVDSGRFQTGIRIPCNILGLAGKGMHTLYVESSYQCTGELQEALVAAIATWGRGQGPAYRGAEKPVRGLQLPIEYWSVVGICDGFTTADKLFRLYSVEQLPKNNAMEWRNGSDNILKDVLFFAEDIFGDQYGYFFENEGGELIKFYCDGGTVEKLDFCTLQEFLLTAVLTAQPTAFDFALATRAIAYGLRCAPDEHLAFTLPLSAGGEYSLENISVEPRALHLGVLAQIFQQSNQPEEE